MLEKQRVQLTESVRHVNEQLENYLGAAGEVHPPVVPLTDLMTKSQVAGASHSGSLAWLGDFELEPEREEYQVGREKEMSNTQFRVLFDLEDTPGTDEPPDEINIEDLSDLIHFPSSIMGDTRQNRHPLLRQAMEMELRVRCRRMADLLSKLQTTIGAKSIFYRNKATGFHSVRTQQQQTHKVNQIASFNRQIKHLYHCYRRCQTAVLALDPNSSSELKQFKELKMNDLSVNTYLLSAEGRRHVQSTRVQKHSVSWFWGITQGTDTEQWQRECESAHTRHHPPI